MAWSFGRDQFVGDFRAKRPKKVEVTDEERQMGVIGDCIEGVDLHREVAPVLEELADHRHRQLTLPKLGHEGSIVALSAWPRLILLGCKSFLFPFGDYHWPEVVSRLLQALEW